MEPKVNNFEFCPKPEIVVHETDVLLIGGGMGEGDWQAGCDRHLCGGDQFFSDWNGILHRVLQ